MANRPARGMIKGMDQHPLPPAEQLPEPATPRSRGTLALCVVSALAIAAGTLGAGVYMNKDSLVWQRILGTEPVQETVRTPADELLPLLDSASAGRDRKGRGHEPETARRVGRHAGDAKQACRFTHTGGLAARRRPRTAAHRRLRAPVRPRRPPPRPRPLPRAWQAPGSALVDAALDAPAPGSRSLAGAGFELTMQARNLLRAAGGTQEQLDRLPAPKPASAATGVSGSSVGPAALPRFMLSGCPGSTDSPAPGPAAAVVV